MPTYLEGRDVQILKLRETAYVLETNVGDGVGVHPAEIEADEVGEPGERGQVFVGMVPPFELNSDDVEVPVSVELWLGIE